jgi:hypothetical protein
MSSWSGARYAKYFPSGEIVGEAYVGLPKRTERGMISSDVVVVTGSGRGVAVEAFIMVRDETDRLLKLCEDRLEKPDTNKWDDRSRDSRFLLTEIIAIEKLVVSQVGPTQGVVL